MNNHPRDTELHGTEAVDTSSYIPAYPAHERDNINELIDSGAKNSFYGSETDEGKEFYSQMAVEELLDRGAHPIALLDTFAESQYSPTYNIVQHADTYLAHGVTPEELFQRVDKTQIEPEQSYLYDQLLLKLLNAGGDGSVILPKLSEGVVYAHKDEFLALGLDPQQVFDAADYRKLRNAKDFEALGVNIDGQKIADSLSDGYKARYFDTLTEYGAHINIQALLDRSKDDSFSASNILATLGSFMKTAPEIDFQAYVDAQTPGERAYYGTYLREQGIAIDGAQLLKEMTTEDYVHENNVANLLELGADPDKLYALYRKSHKFDTVGYLKPFVEAGIKLKNIDRVVAKLDDGIVASQLTELIAVGATVDVNALAIGLDDYSLNSNFEALIKNGLRIDKYYLGRLEAKTIQDNFDAIVAAGFDAETLEARISESEKKAQKLAQEAFNSISRLDFDAFDYYPEQ